jgi:dTDP-4-dehydrorhamnose reductase
VSWCQFANAIFEQTGRQTVASPILTSDNPTQAFRPFNSRLNCSQTEDVFGILRLYWRDGLEKIFKELEQRHDKA